MGVRLIKEKIELGVYHYFLQKVGVNDRELHFRQFDQCNSFLNNVVKENVQPSKIWSRSKSAIKSALFPF